MFGGTCVCCECWAGCTVLLKKPQAHAEEVHFLQLEALLLLWETAAQAARSRQECGQRLSGDRFVAGGCHRAGCS